MTEASSETEILVSVEPNTDGAKTIHKFEIGVRVRLELKLKKGIPTQPTGAWNTEEFVTALFERTGTRLGDEITADISIIVEEPSDAERIIVCETWLKRGRHYAFRAQVNALVDTARAPKDWFERFDLEFQIPPTPEKNLPVEVTHGALAPITEPKLTMPLEWEIARRIATVSSNDLNDTIHLVIEDVAICHECHLLVRANFGQLRVAGDICLATVRSLRRVASLSPGRRDGTPHVNIDGYNNRLMRGSTARSVHAYGHAVDIDTFENGNWYFDLDVSGDLTRAQGIDTIAQTGPDLASRTALSYDNYATIQDQFNAQYDAAGTNGVATLLRAAGLMSMAGAMESFRRHGFFALAETTHDAFTHEQWIWGGGWSNPKDIHHFEYPDAALRSKRNLRARPAH